MVDTKDNIAERIKDSYSALTNSYNVKNILSIFAETSMDNTFSDLTALYLASGSDISDFILYFKKGNYDIWNIIPLTNPAAGFIIESKEITLILKRKDSPFIDILLCNEMQSGAALPLVIGNKVKAILFLNSTKAKFYDRVKLNYLKALSEITSLMFQDLKLNKELTQIINALSRK